MILARLYIQEDDHVLNQILRYLHDEINIKGVTVLRGISGFGKSRKLHTSKLLSLSLSLPLVIEFFDENDKTMTAIKHLKDLIGKGHIIYSEVNGAN